MDAITSLFERGSPPWHEPSQLAAHLANSGETLLARSTNNTWDPLQQPQEYAQNMLTAWIVLQLAGQIALPILIATLLFSKRIARRNPTIVNLCIVWTLATIPPELLFYTDKATGPQLPSTMLCLFQASTISAVPPMAAMAYLSVVIHACSVIHENIHSQTPRPFAFDLRMVFLLGSPYICFLGFALLIAVIGSQNPADVQRQLFFCEVVHHRSSIPVFSFAVIIVTLTLAAQGWIGVMFYRNFMNRRRRPNTNATSRPLHNISAVDVQLLIRMVAFTLFEVVIVFSSISAIFSPDMYAAQLLFATPPFAVFVIFSSSRDIYEAWFPCLFRRKATSESKSSESRTEPEPEKTPNWEVLPSSPQPESTLSRYSQASSSSRAGLVPPPPAITKDARMYRERDVDLEKGVVLPRSGLGVVTALGLDGEWRGQGSSTVKVVGGSNPSSPESPMSAIRALRASTGSRSKS